MHPLKAINDLPATVLILGEVAHWNWNVQQERFDKSTGFTIVPNIFALIRHLHQQDLPLLDVGHELVYRVIIRLGHQLPLSRRNV